MCVCSIIFSLILCAAAAVRWSHTYNPHHQCYDLLSNLNYYYYGVFFLVNYTTTISVLTSELTGAHTHIPNFITKNITKPHVEQKKETFSFIRIGDNNLELFLVVNSDTKTNTMTKYTIYRGEFDSRGPIFYC